MALGTPDWGKYGVEAPGGDGNQSSSSDSTNDSKQHSDSQSTDQSDGEKDGESSHQEDENKSETTEVSGQSTPKETKKYPPPVPYDRFLESTRRARQLEAQYQEQAKRTAELEAQLKLLQSGQTKNKPTNKPDSERTWLDDYLDENDGNGQGGQGRSKDENDLVTLLREERAQRLAAQEQAKEAQGLAKVDSVLKGLEKDFGIPQDKALRYLAKEWTVEEVIEELAPHYHKGSNDQANQSQRPLSRVGGTGNGANQSSGQRRPVTMSDAHAELKRLLGNV